MLWLENLKLTQFWDGCGEDPDPDHEGQLHSLPLQVEDLEALVVALVVSLIGLPLMAELSGPL